MDNNDIVSIYQKILSGERKKFPSETWTPHKDGFSSFKKCFHYIWNKLELSRDDLKKVNKAFFTKYKLRGALQTLFNDSPFEAISYVFESTNIREWELRQTPVNFWNKETSKEAVRWLFNEKLNYTKDEIIKYNLSYHRLLNDYNIGSVLKHFSGFYELINHSFPEYEFKFHEFMNLRWSDDYVTSTLKWLIEDHLGWSLEKARDNLRVKHFRDAGIYNLIEHKFNQSPYSAMKFAYPWFNWGRLKRFNRVRYMDNKQ